MEKSNSDDFKEKLVTAWDKAIKKTDEGSVAEMGREKIVVFIVSLILALCLWLMVNLSRDYNINLNLPISLGAVPENQALSEDLPSTATVSIMGEGWKLINLYNNPPIVNIDVTESELNLYSQVQQQMTTQHDVNVQKVQPLILTLDLEERTTKKVPVRPVVNVSFDDQYDFIGTPSVEPDSITISGATSLVEGIEEWPTDSVAFEEVSRNLSQPVELKDTSNLISLSHTEIEYNASVAQFTEGEAQVDVEGRNLPEGRNVSYSPNTINIKYDVPIHEFPEIQDLNPFEVYVTYEQLMEDSTGFITPQVDITTDDQYNIKVRSLQPRRISYFMILD